MEQIKTVADLLSGDSSHTEDIFNQPEWLLKKGVTMLPADDPKVGWLGFVLFDKKGNESWPVRQAWPKPREVEHKRFHALVRALSSCVKNNVLCLKCHEPKKLRIGFLSFRGSGVEWHFSNLNAIKAWRKGEGKSVRL